MKKIKPKETVILISTIFTFVIAIIFIILHLCKIYIDNEDLPNTIITTSGIFIGFLISALGIYYSIPLGSEIKKSLKDQGFYDQISRNYIVGLLAFFICILVNVVQLCIYQKVNNIIFMHYTNMLSVLTFIFGLSVSVINCVNFFKVIRARL